MITPTALNVLIVGAMSIIFTAMWRALAIRWADSPTGKAMSLVL